MSAKASPNAVKKAPGAQPKSNRKAKQTPRRPAATTPSPKAEDKSGWGTLAALGAAGAGVAALVYALGGKRGAASRLGADPWPAHQVDGRNSSDQFAAQIADENMIPERVPEAID